MDLVPKNDDGPAKRLKQKRRRHISPLAGIDLDDIPAEEDLSLGATKEMDTHSDTLEHSDKRVTADGETLLTLSLDGTGVVSRTSRNSRNSRRRSFAGSLRQGSDVMAFSQLEAELERLERVAHGPTASDDTPFAPLVGGEGGPKPALALFAKGLEAALPTLHQGARSAMDEGIEGAVGGAALGQAGPKEAELQQLLRQAAGATATAMLSDAHVDAAARTYASLHPAARNLLRGMGDVRAKAAEVAVAFAGHEAGARLRSSVQAWEGARWTTEDAFQRTKALQQRRAAWRAAVEAGLQAHWTSLQQRVEALQAAWNQVVSKYDAVLRVACGARPSLDVARFLIGFTEANLQEANDLATLEALRRSIAHFLDSWAARDTDVRTACFAAEAAVPSAAALSETEASLSALQARLGNVEAGIHTARRRIVEAQKTQLAQLMLAGGGADGSQLAHTLQGAATLQAAADGEIDALYAERRNVKEALAAADATMGRAADATRAQAAALVLKTHARWRAAALKAQADVAQLEQEGALLRIYRTSQLQALDTEVHAEHGRILESARAAYGACASQSAAALDQSLSVIGAQRAASLAALEAAESVLGAELHGLMASTGSSTGAFTGGVPGLAVGMPQPAVKMVDDTMRTAVVERLGKAHVATLRDHAAQLQPVADGLSGGLPRPAPLASSTHESKI